MDQDSAKWREILERSGVYNEMLLEVAEIFRNTGSQDTLRKEKKKGKQVLEGKCLFKIKSLVGIVLFFVFFFSSFVVTGTFLLWEHRAPWGR